MIFEHFFNFRQLKPNSTIDFVFVNQSIIELDDGDLVIGGFGFREGNSGGPISLLRLDPSNFDSIVN